MAPNPSPSTPAVTAPSTVASTPPAPTPAPATFTVQVVDDSGPARHEVAADWATVIATVVAAIAIIISLVVTAMTRRQAVRDKRDLFETEILNKLIDTVPDPDSEKPLPEKFITTEQFELVAMISGDALPAWRDFMALIGQASEVGTPIRAYVAINAKSGKPVLNPLISNLWIKHGFAPMKTWEQTTFWILRRDIFRAIAHRNGRSQADVDAWLERLYGKPVLQPGQQPTAKG